MEDFVIIVWGEKKGCCADRKDAELFAAKVADEEHEPAIVKCGDKILSECYEGALIRFDEEPSVDYANECLEALNEDDEFPECDEFDDEVSEVGYNPYTGGWDADL